ncbi:hypothetical protein L484_025470 [Morus notabilis]|uniref:HTH myb-type domain-containing protein n=1 Tax=Morus notabilis TaxID=981085 RepID=W9RNZ2_9ROSA|nr:hypothetical protein L484_025470 [Morus notabilis]
MEALSSVAVLTSVRKGEKKIFFYNNACMEKYGEGNWHLVPDRAGNVLRALIAGRIPGRTANDINKFWNTHLRKKVFPSKIEVFLCEKSKKDDNGKRILESNVIKLHPPKFPKPVQQLQQPINITKTMSPEENNIPSKVNINNNGEPSVEDQVGYY